MTKASALPYYGGKAYHADWIASLLPSGGVYIEPYAGMLSVLLARYPSQIEIVNDLNSDLVNWWRVLRDRTDELARMVDLTPCSREVCADADGVINGDCDDPVRRAWAFHVRLSQGFNSLSSRGKTQWKRSAKKVPFARWLPERFQALASRMADVQIDNVDAIVLLDRVKDETDAVVYVDPPYHSAYRGYETNAVDVGALTDALASQRGRVAVSGYPGEWDHLGWRHEDRETVAHSQGPQHGATQPKRIERLWMNYEIEMGIFR